MYNTTYIKSVTMDTQWVKKESDLLLWSGETNILIITFILLLGPEHESARTQRRPSTKCEEPIVIGGFFLL